jgi:hypothetical protein
MPGYVEAHTDEEGNLVLGIRDSGVVETGFAGRQYQYLER